MSDNISVSLDRTSNLTPAGLLPDYKAATQFESKKPDIKTLVNAFKETLVWVDPFRIQCKRNADTRFCRWPGQTWDQRKHTGDIGKQALPWEGASDMRFFFIDSYIKYLVAMIMASWRRARITANPSNSSLSDIQKANRAANFMKFILNQIPDLYKQSEIALNHLFEKQVCVTYQGWVKEIRKIKKCVKLADFPVEEQLAFITPEMEDIAVKIVKDYFNNPQFNADYLQDAKDGEEDYTEEEIREKIRELREEGETDCILEIPAKDQAIMYALSPDEQLIMPAYTIDVQDAPYLFQVMYYTPQQLRSKVATDGWDKGWVEHAIATYPGVDNLRMANGVRYDGNINIWEKLRDLVQVIHCWQKVSDKEGNIAVYETILHPNDVSEENVSGHQPYARHRLSDYNHGEYPFVVTKLEDYSQRMYEGRSLVEVLKGTQENYKAQLDAKIDRTSLTNLPPLKQRQNGLQADGGYIAPATKILMRNPDDLTWMEPPQVDAIGEEMIKELRLHADLITGRNNPEISPVESQNRLQMYHDKWAEHLAKVGKQIFALWMQFGRDDILMRVDGSQELVNYKKDPMEVYDFHFALNSSTNDWEQLEKKMTSAVQLIGALDQNGTVDKSKAVAYGLNEIDPEMANAVIQGQDGATEKSIREEREAINSITSAQDIDIPENEYNATKAQYYMQWFQRPDVQQRLAADPIVAQIATKRAQQWQQQQQQFQVNAQTGRLGTAPGNAGQA